MKGGVWGFGRYLRLAVLGRAGGRFLAKRELVVPVGEVGELVVCRGGEPGVKTGNGRN